jgi:hypothetical protein
LRIPNLLEGCHFPVNSLRQRLPNEVSLNLAGLDQIEDRSERASVFVTGAGLHIARGQIFIVKHKNDGNLAIAPETPGNGHVELGRIQVGQIEKADGCLMAVNAFDLLFPIA